MVLSIFQNPRLFVPKKRTLLSAFMLGMGLNPAVALAQNNCSILLKKVLYADSCRPTESTSCVNICQFSTPQTQPSCFQTLALNCEQKNQLLSLLPNQPGPGVTPIVEPHDLYRYFRDRRSELYTYFTLKNLEWNGFREDPVPAISEGGRLVQVNNFRLGLDAELQNNLRLLREATLRKRYLQAQAWERYLTGPYASDLAARIQNFPALTSDESRELQNSVQKQIQDGLNLWQKSKALGQAAFLPARLRTLKKTSDEARVLAHRLQGLYASDVQKVEPWLQNIEALLLSVPCAPEQSASCIPEADATSWHQRLDRLDAKAEWTLAHLKTLGKIQTDAGTLADGNTELDQDLKIIRQARSFMLNPSSQAYELLKVGLWPQLQGYETTAAMWASLEHDATLSKKTASPLLSEQGALSPYSCTLISTTQQRVENLREEIKLLYQELEVLSERLAQDASSETIAAFDRVLTQLTEKTQEKLKLAEGLYLKRDRISRLVWDISDLLVPYSMGAQVQIESIQVQGEGYLWTPLMGIRYNSAFSDIADLRSDIGSLDAYGTGRLGPGQHLELLVRQSPSQACSSQEKMRILVRILSPDGDEKRILLSN